MKDAKIDLLMLSNWDWSNTGYRLHKCAKKLGLNAVFFKGQPHNFAYPEQGAIHPKIQNAESIAVHPVILRAPELQPMLNNAHLVQFMDGTYIDTGVMPKKSIICYGGTTYRMEPKVVSDMFNSFTSQSICYFPSLLGLGAANEELIYYPVDTDFLEPNFKIRNKRLRIGHNPSNVLSKGTQNILEVIKKLVADEEFIKRFEYIGVTPEQFATKESRQVAKDIRVTTRILTPTFQWEWLCHIDRLRSCDIYIEALKTELNGRPFGEWGNAALEAASLGKIVITHSINKDVYQREYGDNPLRIANSQAELEAHLIELQSMTDKEIIEEKKRTRQWAEDKHSISATANRWWDKVYSNYFNEDRSWKE